MTNDNKLRKACEQSEMHVIAQDARIGAMLVKPHENGSQVRAGSETAMRRLLRRRQERASPGTQVSVGFFVGMSQDPE